MYDFDSIIKRRNTNCVKWDEDKQEDIIPLWVADMDFKTAPCIQQALEKRVNHGVFGYAHVPQQYYDAVVHWFGKRHGWKIVPSNIIYTTGVVPALSAVIKAYCSKGDKILVQTPIYNCFFSSIRNNECILVDSPLVLNNRRYEIDFEDFEKKIIDNKVKCFLLCNPHNPAGRVWTKQELLRMGEICNKHKVLVISDEIHCELVMPNYKYIPYASIGKAFEKNSVILCSPSKSFNIAGLQIANIVCTEEDLSQKINKAINVNEICDVNPFGIEALIAAYTQGESWIEELNLYIKANYDLLRAFFSKQYPYLKVVDMEGTYLAWVDVSALSKSSEEVCQLLLERAKVRLNPGTMYGTEGFVRINLATSQALLQQALLRIKDSKVLDM
ncbi:MAG: MalY/PatB family protein [Bacteroidota bacterium]|nr:MalY/PatB family protein [Bacteroidota bacterium]